MTNLEPKELQKGYPRQHLFFCTNSRNSAKQSCGDQGVAFELYRYAKARIQALGLVDVQVSQSGCLGQCKKGPAVVIYPDGIWYRCADKLDVEAIIIEHVLHQQLIQRLLMPSAE